MLLFYIPQKRVFTKSACFLNMYYHVSFRDNK